MRIVRLTGGHCLLKNPMQNHCSLSPGAVTTIANIDLVLSMCSALCRGYLIPTMLHYPPLWSPPRNTLTKGQDVKSQSSCGHPWPPMKHYKSQIALLPSSPNQGAFNWEQIWLTDFPKRTSSTQGKLQSARYSEYTHFSDLLFSSPDSLSQTSSNYWGPRYSDHGNLIVWGNRGSYRPVHAVGWHSA